jgi:hypothetical protein
MKTFLVCVFYAAMAAAQTVTEQTTARLIDSGDGPIVPVPAGATEPAEPRVLPLRVAVPNAQAPRLMTLVNPSIAIPFDSPIRQIQAFWNSTPLKLVDPSGTGLVEEAHSYGSMIPFFKPLFSLTGIAPGSGTLEIRALDAGGTQVASVSIPSLAIVAPPAPVATTTIEALPHPRIYLTASRMAAIRARGSADLARQRYEAALNRFLDALARIPDVTSPQFENEIYDPESYIPLLALTYQLRKGDDPSTAAKVAGAAHTLAMRIANAYDSGARDFGRDTGYDIRFGLRNLMLAYDWMYDQFSPTERVLMVKTATRWIDWYHTTPGYAESWPVENYYGGYIQGIALTGVATAGDSSDADRILTLMRSKLSNEMPVMNQRLAGGDWAEGWNYGWYSVLEFALVNTLLRDLGEEWGPVFDWMQPTATSLWYHVSPDFAETRSFGGYSGNYANRTSPASLAVLSTINGYADVQYRSMNANPDNDFTDLPSDTFYETIFETPAAAMPALPLSYLNAGTGRFFSRSSLSDPNAYFVSAENTSYSYDHYGYANGDVRLYHGATCLVCPSAYRGPAFAGEDVTPAFSTYLVNGGEQPIGLGRNNQNFLYLERGNFAALGMRFESSWAENRFDEGIVSADAPLDYIIREVVHLRPGTMIVRDLHRRRHTTDTLAARWHLGSSDAVQNLGGGYRVGALNISAIYPAGVTVSFSNDVDEGGNGIGTLMQLQFASSTAPMELVTVFSETLTATSYAGGTLTLTDGTRVVFSNGSVDVQPGRPAKRRAVTH